MKLKKVITIGVLGILLGAGWYVYKFFFTKKTEVPFKTQKPERRDIFNMVQAEGSLEAQGTSNIGSLIQGTIKKILVAENQDVKEGHLLALIDNGFGGNEGDSILVQKQALLEQARVAVDYLTSNYRRKETLYKAGQLAQDEFEKITKDFLMSKADLKNKQADYEHELYRFKQTKVLAPHDGTVLAIPVKEGELVTPYATTSAVLFKIAKDLTTMKVTLHVDEGKVGDVKIGQGVNFTVDTYPYLEWKGVIETIAKNPVEGIDQTQKKSIYYKVEFLVKDLERLLRPGMTVHAKIKAGKAKKALALPGFVFQFSPKIIEAMAKTVNYTCRPLDLDKKKELSKDRKHPHKFIWVVEEKVFIERPVEVGLSDNAFFEICQGLAEQDDVVFDLIENDASKELMKKLVGGGL